MEGPGISSDFSIIRWIQITYDDVYDEERQWASKNLQSTKLRGCHTKLTQW